MTQRSIYWKFLMTHFAMGWGFALLFSLGITHLLADANPILLMMAFGVPVISVVISKKRLHELREDDPSQQTTRLVVVSFVGFGLGMLVHLLIVFVVFSG